MSLHVGTKKRNVKSVPTFKVRTEKMPAKRQSSNTISMTYTLVFSNNELEQARSYSIYLFCTCFIHVLNFCLTFSVILLLLNHEPWNSRATPLYKKSTDLHFSEESSCRKAQGGVRTPGPPGQLRPWGHRLSRNGSLAKCCALWPAQPPLMPLVGRN